MTRTRIENASLSVHIYHMNVFSPVHSRTRAIALYRPASHGCSFVNGARKEYVCFAAAFFSSALIISRFASSMLTAADAAIVIAIRHKSASSFLAHLRSLYHIFLYSSSAISSVFSQNICSQMCAQVTGFCRCFAFQIGKICNQNCSVRDFQFGKFLPVNSYEHAILCKQNFIENRY